MYVPAVENDCDAWYIYCWPGCSVTAGEGPKSKCPFDASRAPTRKYCTLKGCPPVFLTVKFAVVDWFTTGEGGEKAIGATIESWPGVALLLIVTVAEALVDVMFDALRARAANV